MRSVRSAFLLLVLPLAFAACKPQEASKMMDDESSIAHSTVVIDLETGSGDAMMAKDASSASAASSAEAMMDHASSSPAAMMDHGSSQAASAAASSAPAAQAEVGTYAAYDDGVLADGQMKVLFFHAAWCPICRAQDTELVSWYGNKDGLLTTYKVDYDAEKDLKAAYGVTYQHTFVKVDGQGKMITKIQGPTESQLLALLSR